MIQLLHTFQKNLGARISWHYFATSHGKGEVDGVGGTVKMTVWSAVSTRKVEIVTRAKSFADAAQQFCQSTSITRITRKNTEEVSKKLNLSLTGKGLPGCQICTRNKQVSLHGDKSQDKTCEISSELSARDTC